MGWKGEEGGNGTLRYHTAIDAAGRDESGGHVDIQEEKRG